MTLDEQIAQALDYFTMEEHEDSFMLLPGSGNVMFSAPHAVLQTRHGRIKCAERFTGMLCLLLHENGNFPAIYKSRHLLDDANHDSISDYRDALCRHIAKEGILTLIDLHQLAPERPMDVCICTGKGQNLLGREDLVGVVQSCFHHEGITHITIDDPFDAMSAHTVSATVATNCGIPAIQLELNSRLLMKECPEYRFPSVLSALSRLAELLS